MGHCPRAQSCRLEENGHGSGGGKRRISSTHAQGCKVASSPNQAGRFKLFKCFLIANNTSFFSGLVCLLHSELSESRVECTEYVVKLSKYPLEWWYFPQLLDKILLFWSAKLVQNFTIYGTFIIVLNISKTDIISRTDITSDKLWTEVANLLLLRSRWS